MIGRIGLVTRRDRTCRKCGLFQFPPVVKRLRARPAEALVASLFIPLIALVVSLTEEVVINGILFAPA